MCGKRLNHPNVVYRKPEGKYDAIDFGARLVPRDVDVVALNDVDTKISNFGVALKYFDSNDVALVFARVSVKQGPQKSFYVILDSIRRKLLVAASGELMFIRRGMLERILPIMACKTEDSYMLFKVFEFKGKVVFVRAVLGNRFNHLLMSAAMRNPFYVGNRFLAFAQRILNGVDLNDPLTGLRAVRWKILKGWKPKSKGFDVEAELNHLVERRGYQIVEVSIPYRARLGEKKLRLSHGFAILKRII